MGPYTRYYVDQSSVEIGPVYRAIFKVQRGNRIGSLFRGLFRFAKPLLYSGARALVKEAFKTSSNIITDILNKETEKHVGDSFKTRFTETKGNLKQKIKKMRGLAWV